MSTADKVWSAVVQGRSETYSLGGGPLPLTGYFVGGATAPLVNPVDLGDVQEFVKHSTTDYVGVWTDTDNGSVYVDDVTWVESFSDAINLAESRAEIAFYDVATGREIRA